MPGALQPLGAAQPLPRYLRLTPMQARAVWAFLGAGMPFVAPISGGSIAQLQERRHPYDEWHEVTSGIDDGRAYRGVLQWPGAIQHKPKD